MCSAPLAISSHCYAGTIVQPCLAIWLHMVAYYSRLVAVHELQHLRPEDVACCADTADPCAIDLVCSSANICDVPVSDGDYCAASGKANRARQI